MSKFLTVFNFEFKQFIKKKSTLVTLAIYLLITLAVTFIPRIAQSEVFKNNSNKDYEKSAYLITNDKIDLTEFKKAQKYSNKEDIQKDVKEGKLVEGIVITNDEYSYITKGSILETKGTEFKKTVEEAVKKYTYSQNNLDYTKITDVTTKIPQPKTINVSSDSDATQVFFNLSAIYIISFIAYITVLMFGSIVATNVVKEKSNRAMELLLVTVKPKTLILGKVLALSIAVLIQISLIIATIYLGIKFNINHYNEVVKEVIRNIDIKIFIVGLVFAITGFVLYMFMYAAFASLAGKMEEVNTVIMVPMMLFIMVFCANFYVMSNPLSKVSEVLSYVPFSSPFAMFTRFALVDISYKNLAISYGILFLSTIIIALACVRVYKGASLRYGKKLSFIKLLFR